MNRSEAANAGLPGGREEVDLSTCPDLRRGETHGKLDAVKPSALGTRLWIRLAIFLNRPSLIWHRLPGRLLGYANLFVQRTALQQANLFDTGLVRPANETPANKTPANKTTAQVDDAALGGRTADGACNDLRCPFTGMAGTRFGRNIPLASIRPNEEKLYSPLPQKIADKLLKRETFLPAENLNMLAAAWIQFMVHDWFGHGDTDAAHLDVPAGEGYPAMRVRCTPQDPTRSPAETGRPPTYVNLRTQWWDGSQIYGSSDQRLQSLRTGAGGKLRLGEDDLLPYEVEAWKPGFDAVQKGAVQKEAGQKDAGQKKEQSGVTDNWWIGLSMFHTLFAREHNSICEALAAAYPDKATDEWLFTKARLITSALLAKIHVLEWTPSTGAHPSLKFGVKLAWQGVLGMCFGTDFLLRTQRLRTWPAWLMRIIHRCEILHPILTGIPGSPALDHGVPFSMTEEFVAAYRMHPLLPDEFVFRSAADGRLRGRCDFDGVLGDRARDLAVGIGMTDLFYSFGVLRPGKLCLHNYPEGLRHFKRPPFGNPGAAGGETLDIAVIDLLRDRERGVPRYNDFREKMHLPRATSFAAVSEQHAEELAQIYAHIDDLDLMVGMLAETPPEGFAYSDTAFRTFVLMASRRLEADRFFTTNYDEDTYTPMGIRWVEKNCLKSVLKRHYPELRDIIAMQDDMFSPWPEPVIGAC